MSYISLSGQETVDFDDAISAGRSALTRLSVLARTLQVVATDPTIKENGTQALRFATEAGPKGLDRAASTKSTSKLAEMQRATAEVAAIVTDAVKDSLVSRFLTLNVLSPEASGQLKEDISTTKIPGAADMPDWVKAALGLGTLVSLAYVWRSFR